MGKYMRKSFLELLHLVARSTRTERLATLIALLTLDATTKDSAVTANQVSKELRQHLRGKAPGNVPNVLRKAGALVESSPGLDKGLRWRLTAAGIERLVESLQLTPNELAVYGPQQKQPHGFDLAIVCAVHKPEFKAVLEVFGKEETWTEGPKAGQTHVYKTTSITTASGSRITVVAGAPTYMGLTATAIVSTQMLLMFRPRMIMMMGIAAGTKTEGRGFGDVLVADPSVDYASGKLTLVKGEPAFQPDTFPLPIDSRLRALVQEDIRTRDGLDTIRRDWLHAKPPTDLNVHIGALGAADQVVDTSARVEQVKQHWRKLIGLEMETYALYRAAHEAPAPKPLYVSFKSVCDFGESKKDDWQEYAAYTSATYGHRYITKNWDSLFPLPVR
jgi:nucleoside phosphorylase